MILKSNDIIKNISKINISIATVLLAQIAALLPQSKSKKNVKISAGSTITHDIEENKLVIARAKQLEYDKNRLPDAEHPDAQHPNQQNNDIEE